MVVRVGAAVQEHPLVARNAECARGGHAGHHHGRRLVDVGMRVHQLRVRPADPAVGVVHRHQLFGAVALAPCRQRVGRSHGSKARHQRADGLLVVFDAAASRAADGVFDQRVHDDGRAHAVQLFMVVPAAPCFADQLGRAARVLVPHADGARALQPMLRAQRLAAAQQHGVHLAAGDAFRKLVQQVLRHVAAAVAVDVARSLQAQALRHAARRVGRGAQLRRKARRGVGKAADHRHRVDGGIDARSAAVLQRQARGLRDQVVGRAPRLGGRRQVGDIAATDEHRHAPIDRLHRRPTCPDPSSARSPLS